MDNAVDQLYRTVGLQDFNEWLEEQAGDFLKVGGPKTTAGEVVAPIAQGATAMIPAARAAKVLGVASSFLQWTMGGAFTDFAAFAPEEPGIADLTSQLGVLPNRRLESVRREVEGWLSKDESDSELKRRLKGAAEGAFLGATVDGIVRVARAAKKILLAIGSGATVSALSSDEAEAGTASAIVKALAKMGIKSAEPFYSTALKSVGEAKTARASGDQWLATMRNAGVKNEELTWLGVDTFLKGRDKVTKGELEEFVRANQVRLEEVKFSKSMPDEDGLFKMITEDQDKFMGDLDFVAEEMLGIRHYDNLREDQQRLVRRELAEQYAEAGGEGVGEIFGDITKFEQYTLSGGRNYTEWLISLPEVDNSDQAARRMFGKPLADLTKGQRAQLEETSQGALTYHNPHFNQPNVLVHVRTKERMTASGDRVLFLEEVQSDWMQEGRKRGFGLRPRTSGWTVEFDKQADGDWWIVKNADGEHMGMVRAEGGVTEADALETVSIRISGGRNDAGFGGVPHAPFKKTWHELAFRRMLRHAAEHDFDRVAWTTGRQQAARYGIGERVDRIGYQKLTDDLYKVVGYYRGRVALTDNFTVRQLRTMFDNDVTDRILAEEGELGPTKWRGFEIEAPVAVGKAEGMKGFYDGIMVNYANKFGRRFGARVEDVKVESGGKRVVKVHSLPITDKMRATALREGFPLFSGAVAPVGVATSAAQLGEEEAVSATETGEAPVVEED